LPGIKAIWWQDVYGLANRQTSFGFRDGISNPAIEGTGIPATNPKEAPIKAGEFFLGYRNEVGEFPPMPVPEVLGRNGTYFVARKLYTRVAAFRQYLRSKATGPEDEERLAAKMVGRWPSGAPLALAPDRDEPELGGDRGRSNDFLYRNDDARGLKCPLGSHVRRMNPRDSEIVGVTRLHRIIRLGGSYGSALPAGVLDDDGVDRGIIFVGLCTNLERQFEFLKIHWINDGLFFGAQGEKDPLAGPNEGEGQFTIPQEPIRQRLKGLPTFVVTRGGEYFFAPSLPALRWLAALDT
jgi:Dyp-type peroxidase family